MKLVFCLLFLFLIEKHNSERLIRIPLKGRSPKVLKTRSPLENLLSTNIPLDIGYGEIEIGLGKENVPQKFSAQFDTGSRGLWVFSKIYDTCDSNYYTVNEKQALYDRTISPTYQAVRDIRPILIYRINGWVFGYKSYDLVTIYGIHINTTFIEVTKSAKYTANDKYSSSVGLQYNPKLQTNIITQLCDSNKNYVFAVSYPRIRPLNSNFSDGQLVFCGTDRSKYIPGSLLFFDLLENERGSWRIPVYSIRLQDSRGRSYLSEYTTVLISTISTQIYMPEEKFKLFSDLMKPYNPGYPESNEFDCSIFSQLPKFIFEDLHGQEFTLMPDDYFYKAQNGAAYSCIALVSKSPNGNWSIGEPVFRRYHTIFDVQFHRVGFAEKIIA